MKKILLITVLSAMFFAVHAQNSKTDTSEVFTSVDQVPEFPGGLEKLKVYIDHNVRKAIRKDTTSGFVIVVSTVEKDGSFTNCQAIRPFNPEADTIAVNIIRKIPKWKPAVKDGKIARCKYSLMVKFGNPTKGLGPNVKELKN